MPHTFVFERRLNRLDALHHHLGEHRNANVAMCMVAVLDRDVEIDTMRSGFGTAAEEIPRFKDRLRPVPGGLAPPVWEADPDFDVRDRFHAVELAPGSDWAAVLALIDDFQSSPFAPRRPPWSVLYVTGAPGGSVVVLKLHHVLSDGTALTLMLSRVFMRQALGDAADDVRAVGSPPPSSVPHEALHHLLQSLSDAAHTATSTLSRALRDRSALRPHVHELREHLTGPRRWPVAQHAPARRCAFFRVPLETWRRAAHERNGGVNDLYVALVAAALQRYRAVTGVDDGRPLAVVMPIDIRDEHAQQDGGNVTGAGILALRGSDAELADLGPIGRQSRVAQAAAGRSPASLVDGVLALCPSGIQRRALFRRFSTKDALATNVIVPLQCGLEEARADMVYILPPVIGTPVSFALTGYDDAVHLALNMDLGLIDAPDALERILSDLLAEICGADAVTPVARTQVDAARAG